MPYVHLRTTEPKSEATQTALVKELTDIIAKDFNKDAGWVMVSCSFDKHIHFQGSADKACYVRVELMGEPNPADTAKASTDICAAVERELGVPQDRVYITYFPTDNWGYNGGNF
jgi:phenylpyruvate tautomerase PptA (4-oxalocrotonate tautomerase family)